MRSIFPKKSKLHQAGLKIVRLLHNKGYEAYFVGGTVRDMLISRVSDNIDIATNAVPDDVESILSKGNIKHKSVGRQFGTVLAIVSGFKIEITTFRSEGFYSDKRHPDKVEFIKDFRIDAGRRDFTVNAMYYDPVKNELSDPVGGLKDIKQKIIRFVGDPKKRIDEDYLRMLRAVRFSIQLGFKVEKNTFAAIKTRAKLIQDVSGERIKQEMDKILTSKGRADGLRLLEVTGLLKFIFPEIANLRGFSHKSVNYHLEGDMLDHTILALKNMYVPDKDLAYAVLFHDAGKPLVARPKKKAEGEVISTSGHDTVSARIFNKIAKKLAFSRESRQKIEWAIKNHSLRSPFMKDMKQAKKIRLVLHPYFPFMNELWKLDATANIKRAGTTTEPGEPKAWKEGKRLLEIVKKSQPLISTIATGNFVLKNSGIKPGPGVGNIIEDLKIKIILGEIKNPGDAKFFLKNSSKMS